jgi:hypothetical protein
VPIKIDHILYILLYQNMSILIQDKRDECDRLINNISRILCLKPTILSGFLLDANLANRDFNELMKLIHDNYTQIQPYLLSEFLLTDIDICREVRNKIYHQDYTNINFLNNAILSLNKCHKAFGIQSPLIPLRILACKTCDTTITRTAQPTIKFKNMEITRTYDVQSWVVANDTNETASRENTFYDGWVSTYTYCAECRKQNILTCLGFRFDWAPEDRIDLTKNTIRYNLQRQAMIVINNTGIINDLTHIVSDGKVRRHLYGLYENQLRELTAPT